MPIPGIPSGSAGTPVVSSDGYLTVTPSGTSLLVTVNGASAAPSATSVQVFRQVSGGSPVTVRGLDGVAAPGGVAAGIAHEVPLSTSVTMWAVLSGPSGVLLTTASVIVSVPGSSSRLQLKSLLTPALSVSLRGRIPDWSFAISVGVLKVLGRPDPVTVSDVRQFGTGSLTLFTETLAEETALSALLNSPGPYLLQSTVGSNRPDCYVVVGDVGYAQPGVDVDAFRSWSLPLTQVARPKTAGVQVALPGHTYADLLRRFPTYADWNVTYLQALTT